MNLEPTIEQDEFIFQNSKRIIKDVCHKHGIKLEAFYGESRLAEVVRARKEVAGIFSRAGQGASEIGRLIKKSHTTILFYLKNHEGQRNNN